MSKRKNHMNQEDLDKFKEFIFSERDKRTEAFMDETINDKGLAELEILDKIVNHLGDILLIKEEPEEKTGKSLQVIGNSLHVGGAILQNADLNTNISFIGKSEPEMFIEVSYWSDNNFFKKDAIEKVKGEFKGIDNGILVILVDSKSIKCIDVKSVTTMIICDKKGEGACK